jgi:chlorobactene glucosyltransferase
MRSLHNWLALSAHFTSLALLTFFTRRLITNVRYLRWARRSATTLPVPGPRVSVLVPARDEATTITSCITLLLRQEYAGIEVLVLDDGSTDGTGEQLDRLAAEHPQLRVMHSHDDPPAGWNGKSYACQRLAEQASGEWLLFTDADTIHTATSVGQGLTYAMAHGAALVSVLPRQRTLTWSERLMVSFILDFLPLIGLDLRAMQRRTSRRVAANGQYLLAHAASYRAVGRHESIRGALVDDFALAERFKSQGFTVLLLDGTDMLSCRMYTSFRELWNGFAKNLLAGPGVSPRASGHLLWQAPVFAWGYACLFVIPFWHLMLAPDKRLPALEVSWLALLRGIVTVRLRRSPDEVLTTPLAALGVMAIGLSSLYRRLTGRDIRWKGRLYRA